MVFALRSLHALLSPGVHQRMYLAKRGKEQEVSSLQVEGLNIEILVLSERVGAWGAEWGPQKKKKKKPIIWSHYVFGFRG